MNIVQLCLSLIAAYCREVNIVLDMHRIPLSSCSSLARWQLQPHQPELRPRVRYGSALSSQNGTRPGPGTREGRVPSSLAVWARSYGECSPLTSQSHSRATGTLLGVQGSAQSLLSLVGVL